ncbi:MAG: FtsX-like permease family protein, partial [Oscillospiraceae bacterium]|nr:FtsX-like permease family protein [Oscillospiraceae bacterium]
NGSIGFGDDSASVSILGVNDETFLADEIELLHGRALQNETDGERSLCVISEAFIREYMSVRPKNCIGQTLSVQIGGNLHTFYIVGVYAEESEDEDAAENTNFYIPLQTARALTSAADGYSSVTVVTTAETDTASFMDTTERFFAGYYTSNDSWTISASSMEQLLSTLTEMIDTVSLAISAIAAISLLVGGIGVMNIMLVSVTERTREIGTRKALGARQRTIRFQFVVESIVICMIGGILGIAVGIALGALGCTLLGYRAQADLAAIVTVVCICIGIGVFFGYYPANKAAKLDPIEALRYE